MKMEDASNWQNSEAKSKTVLAFDVGDKRVGVAKATVPPRIAQPLTTLLQDENFGLNLKKIIEMEKPDIFVVGRPLNQNGEPTAQTEKTHVWAQNFLVQWEVQIFWQDESLTSAAAQMHLQTKKGGYKKEEIDSLAASIILTDFLETAGVNKL